jgi:hypothetical protein
MSWYDSAWKYRAPVSVDNTAGSGGTKDWTLVLPNDWDHFWTNALANGYDVVLTSSDGLTKLAFDRSVWNTTTKAGTLRVDGVTLTANTHCAWIYYGNPAASVDPAATVTISAPLSAFVEVADPRRESPAVVCRPERPGRTVPTAQISKPSTETTHVWWDLSRVLQRRTTANNGKRLLEEIDYVKSEIYAGTNAQSAMVDGTQTRIVGGRYVRTTAKAGTSGTDYTPRLTVTTTNLRVLDFRALLRVLDVDED